MAHRDADLDDPYTWPTIGEDDLPGMWSKSDYLGGDPDERSYAERNRDLAADAVSLWPTDAPVGYDGFGAPLYAHQIDPQGTE